MRPVQTCQIKEQLLRTNDSEEGTYSLVDGDGALHRLLAQG